MSISQIQIKNILELIAKSYFVNGINPQTSQLHSYMSQYFSKNPAGNLVTLDLDLFANAIVSDVDKLNDFMSMMIVNIDTLYEVCSNHVEQSMMLNSVLRTHLERLKIKRKVLEQKVDDYLLGIYNSDGYFFSISDDFSSVGDVDFNFTSAFVDTIAGTISLPAISSMSRRISPASVGDPNISIVDINGRKLTWATKTSFANAFDGMTNTAWYIEVRTATPITVTANVELFLATSLGDTKVSRIDLIPFGVSPVQCGVNAVFIGDNLLRKESVYCHYVKTSSEKMSFIGDQIDDDIERIQLQLTKVEPDYEETNTNGSKSFVYMFGFKEILMTEQVYDATATFMSQPFGIPAELIGESVIDAVSIVTEDYIPTNTSLKYYVAAENAAASSIDDFDWKEITPITSSSTSDNIVAHFRGSSITTKLARIIPRAFSDIKLISLNDTSNDLTKRNPTPAYLPGLDVYRVIPFSDEFLAGTLSIEEGINTTKLYFCDYDADAYSQGFDFWKLKFADPTSYSVSYGEIDSGHEFFYGGDVGEDGKSVYAETFLITEQEYPIFLKECSKSDTNSQLWDVRIFLNGREIANMPVGTNRLTVPWKLKKGKNHIVIMSNIPEATTANPSPYIGTINLVVDGKLQDFGTVKLDNWIYVDPYKFENNQGYDSNTFTIYNDEIIARKKPTNNFRIKYKKPTSTSPDQIRLRADFGRSSNNSKSTPIFDSYRVRFSYGEV